ncbi:MAG TPA: HlyD family efflux transporter periplasmic adaptor subunit, partial [Gemmataceae bacterium]|nr:HlyD family efflux transporter periplasmic adaptor subunit [Gemmataceae bacterium]
MLRWLVTCGIVVVLATGGFYLLVGSPRQVDSTPSSSPDAQRAAAVKKPAAKGELHAAEAPAAGAAAPPDHRDPPPPSVPGGALPLIVIPEGRVNAIYKQEVPTQHEGQLLFIGAEITEEAAKKLPPDQVIKARIGSLWVQLAPGEKEKNNIPESDVRRWRVPVSRHNEADPQSGVNATEVREYRRLQENEEINLGESEIVDPQRVQLLREDRFFRRLQEGDEVGEGQLLGMINPSLAVDDMAIKKAKLNAAVADLLTALKTRDEAEQRYITNQRLHNKSGGPVVSLEDLRGAKLTWERYIYESVSKMQAIAVSAAELKQSQTNLEMHYLRSKVPTPGRIKAVYKQRGEAVKTTDPVVLQIFNPEKLRIEGLVEMQYVGLLKEGQEVVVEPTRFVRHDKLLRGHLQEITGVAVSKRNEIVSASEDRTVRVWDRNTGNQKLRIDHPTPVHAVACT